MRLGARSRGSEVVGESRKRRAITDACVTLGGIAPYSGECDHVELCDRNGGRMSKSKVRRSHVNGTTLIAVWTPKHGQYIHSTYLCNCLIENPENQLAAECGRDALYGEARCIAQLELTTAPAAGPRAYLVIQGEQGEALAVGIADVCARMGADDV